MSRRKNRKSVGRQDFLDAVDRIVGGLEKKNKIITPEEKETIAYHERNCVGLEYGPLKVHCSKRSIPRSSLVFTSNSVEQKNLTKCVSSIGGRAEKK